MKVILFAILVIALVQAVTIHVVEHANTDTVIPVGPKPDNFGDGLVWSNPIYDATNVQQIGTDQGNCIRTVVGAAWECRWLTIIPGGSLTVEGPFYDAKNSTLVVTGGTGKYKGAWGEMILGHRSNTSYDFIFEINLRN